MTDTPGAILDRPGQQEWQDADLVSALIAVDPAGLGGVTLHAGVGPARDRWIDIFKARFETFGPVKRVPAGISEDRLIGGIDLAATLAAGHPVMESGLLAQADRGALLVPMAERLERRVAAHMAGALDTGSVRIERSGLSESVPSRFAVILLDERVGDEAPPPHLLVERLAFQLSLHQVSQRDIDQPVLSTDLIRQGRERLPLIRLDDDIARAVDQTALRFGVASLRTVGLALKAARAIAALDAASEVAEKHAILAARLVLAPRAAEFPDEIPDAPDQPPPDDGGAPDDKADQDDKSGQNELEDRLVEAVQLACALHLSTGRPRLSRSQIRALEPGGGRAGVPIPSLQRGQVVGTRPGDPRRGGRLDLIATLQAAAPWQKVRGRVPGEARLKLGTDDFRLRRQKAHAASVVIFVVDASGSLAMNRMAESKGAVELLLTDCYTRRDYVALIAFRKDSADLLLPPTRSLTRVRRSLTTLPGGGGTPLASGLAAAFRLANSEQARGRTPHVVVLSDGNANMSLAGEPGREQAGVDARNIGRRIRAAGFPGLFLDTSRRSNPNAVAIAAEMGAHYQLLPVADSQTVSRAVRTLVSQ